MKKLLLILLITLFGSGAFAQDLHFGAKIGLDVPQFVGIFLRYDFADRSERGFGVRLTAGGLVFVSVGVFNVEANGYYRFARQPSGSGAYVGGGLGFLYGFAFGLVGNGASPLLWYVNGLLGYEIQLGDGIQFYAEVRPTIPLGSGMFSIVPFFGLGFLFEF